MPVANYKRTTIHYHIEGQGPTLVFIHGFGEDSRMWTEFVKAFNENQIICIDLPGFGKSKLFANANIHEMACAIGVVLQQERVNKCVLVGHSMGGYVALAFANIFPKNLLGLGLFHSHPYTDTIAKSKNRSNAIDFVQKYGVPLYIKQLMPLLFPKAFKNEQSFVVDKMVYYGSQASTEGIVNALNAMKNRPDRSYVLRETKVPVLFIVGKEDAAIPLADSLSQTHLPVVSDIHIYERVGHMGMFERPEETKMAIKNFVDFCLNFSYEQESN